MKCISLSFFNTVVTSKGKTKYYSLQAHGWEKKLPPAALDPVQTGKFEGITEDVFTSFTLLMKTVQH